MKRFQSNVQALLTLRQRAEQAALERYASTLLARQAALDSLESVRLAQNESWVRRRQELDHGCSAGSLNQWDRVVARLRSDCELAERALSQTEVTVNQSMQQMLEARRDREAVEKHVQRQRGAHQRELGREEQKTLDELAQRRIMPAMSLAHAHSCDA